MKLSPLSDSRPLKEGDEILRKKDTLSKQMADIPEQNPKKCPNIPAACRKQHRRFDGLKHNVPRIAEAEHLPSGGNSSVRIQLF